MQFSVKFFLFPLRFLIAGFQQHRVTRCPQVFDASLVSKLRHEMT